MKYYLIKELTNDKGQDGSTISVYDTLDTAIVAYHQTLTSYHNASDVLYAVVQIHDEYGRVVGGYVETVDHREPEPSEYIEITDINATAEAGVTYYVLIDNQYVEDTGVNVGDRVFGKYVIAE